MLAVGGTLRGLNLLLRAYLDIRFVDVSLCPSQHTLRSYPLWIAHVYLRRDTCVSEMRMTGTGKSGGKTRRQWRAWEVIESAGPTLIRGRDMEVWNGARLSELSYNMRPRRQPIGACRTLRVCTVHGGNVLPHLNLTTGKQISEAVRAQHRVKCTYASEDHEASYIMRSCVPATLTRSPRIRR